jgi:hypothetical protein
MYSMQSHRAPSRGVLRALVVASALALAAAAVTGSARDATRSTAPRATPLIIGASAPLGRLYAPASPFNRPIPPDAAIDPQSDRLVQGLAAAARQGGVVIAVKRWTVPVYVATARTPRYRVSLAAPWAPRHALSGVPIANEAAPDPAADGHLAIIDQRNRCEYDLWKAHKKGRTWTAAWGNSLRTSGSGVYRRGFSARGAGLALLQELADGRIDHALVFSYPYTSAAGFVSPATETDGSSTQSDAIPEGALLQLDPTFDVSSLPTYDRTIGRALQLYGMYLADTSARNVSLYAVSPQSYPHNPYAGILPSGDYVDLRDIPIERFRVLAHGPVIRHARLSLEASGCGRFR